MENFPATSNMTDFEIVEMENEHRRKIKNRQRIEANRQRELEINQRLYLANANEEENRFREQNLVEARITHQMQDLTLIEQDNPLQTNNLVPHHGSTVLSSIQIIVTDHGDYNFDDNECMNPAIDQVYTTDVTSDGNEDADYQSDDVMISTKDIHNDTNASSNKSFHSAKSDNSSSSSSTVLPEVLTNNVTLDNLPVPTRCNDITFIGKLNHYNRTRKDQPRYIISSMNPSYACSLDHNYFLCHACQRFPNTNPIGIQGHSDKNDYPFPRNIEAILKHMRINHCKKDCRQLNGNAEQYLLSKTRDLRNHKLPLLQKLTSIPKSPSTSCLNTTWKSNQTELTKQIVNTYYVEVNPSQNNIIKPCKGHAQLMAREGIIYTSDLANSIYCSCNSKQIVTLGEKLNPENYPNIIQNNIMQISRKSDKLSLIDTTYCLDKTERDKIINIKYPGPDRIPSQDNTMIPVNDMEIPTFFNLHRTSIHQLPKIFLCQYTYRFKEPQEMPTKRAWLVATSGTTITRSMKQNQPTQTEQPTNNPRPLPTTPRTVKTTLKNKAIQAADAVISAATLLAVKKKAKITTKRQT